jgi:hypothetical protein
MVFAMSLFQVGNPDYAGWFHISIPVENDGALEVA